MTDTIPTSTPLPLGLKILKQSQEDGPDPAIHDFDYPSFIGSIMFLMLCTQGDICFAVSYLSKFSSNPPLATVNACKRLLRYLVGTKDRCLVFNNKSMELVGYTDANWAGDVEDQRTITQ